MTEISYLWDGVVTGDATSAPYDRDEFNTYIFMLQAPNRVENRAFVSPNYGNNLRVYSNDTAMSVTVDTGAAMIDGRFAYTLDTAVSLSIDPVSTSGYFRYDYVVLRSDKNAQTIRLAIIKGGETASEYSLSNPALVQISNFKEIPLAKIYVDDSGIVYDKYIYDMREFAMNYFSENAHKLSYNNLVKNSEFMAYSGEASSYPPDEWSGSVVGLSASTKLSKMSRGQSVQMDSTAYSSEVPLLQNLMLDTSDRTYTIKGMMKVISGGDTGYAFVELLPSTQYATWYDGALSGTSKRQEYPKIEPDTEIEFQFTVTFDNNSAMKAVLLRVGAFGGAVVDIGQIIVVPGYFPGPFREISETIMFREALTTGTWSATAKSTSTVSINLASLYGVQEKTKGVHLRLRGRDSGSAAGNASIQVQGYTAPYDAVYGRVELDGITNDVYRENTFYVPVNAPLINSRDGTPQLRIGVVATGALTFDATVEIVGVAV